MALPSLLAMLCVVSGPVFPRLAFSIPEYHRKQHNSPLLLYICSSVATGDFPSAREDQQVKTGIQESPNQSHLAQSKICCIFIEKCFRLPWINYSLESVCHI